MVFTVVAMMYEDTEDTQVYQKKNFFDASPTLPGELKKHLKGRN